MEVLRKYGVQTTILFPLIDAGAQDFEATPVTHAAGDTQISKDEGAFANTSNAFAHEGKGIYSIVLTATEMQAARIVVVIVDSATKAWEDQAVIISTYGNASGQHAFDLDTATQDVNVTQISGDSTAADNCEAFFDNTGFSASNSTIGWNSAWDAEVQSECNDALVALNLDHLLSASSVDADVANNSVIAKICDSGTAPANFSNYNNDTDSLRALRDRGDASWITATGFSTHSAADVRTEMDSNSTQLAAIVADTNELQTDNVPGLIAALNDISTADVNAQVVDALATDTYAEPTGVPPATASLAAKINHLYMRARNKVTVTATKKTIFDDSDNAEYEHDLSDDGTTATKSEANIL